MLLNQLLEALGVVEEFFWSYVGAPGLIALGLYFTWKSGFFQIRQIHKIIHVFNSFARKKYTDNTVRGIEPLQAFFASIGGAIGTGNLVSVGVTLQIGGPGAVFWLWFAGLMGMLVKYGEIFLGVKFRVKNNENSYTGGPLVYLRHVAYGSFWSGLVAVLMCLYGTEIYIFIVVTYTLSECWNLNQYLVILALLFLVIGVGQGGVRTVGKVCSKIIPLFLIAYIGMGLFVLAKNFTDIPGIITLIFKHAFTPHAAIGAFAGNTIALAITHGVRRACYVGDIGVGYASTMHAETQESVPARQAVFGIVDVFLDVFVVCTMSMMIILVSGMWYQDINPAFMVSTALSKYFSFVPYIWPLFIFLLGYTTLIAFFAAGRRAATALFPRYGARIYELLGACSLLIFSFLGTDEQCLSAMSIVGSLLLVCNLYGLFMLKDHVTFTIPQDSGK
ncbi:sodium:alanine symporter family protein [Candidatus Dependentiae bacterium]|nr:sodium:alanine symporter family protein [Candidatus Dependentiae bacterium]